MAGPCFLTQATPREIDRYLKDNPDVVNMIWRYAKENFASKGLSPYDAAEQMSEKFNVPSRLITQAIDAPKALRRMSDQLRQQQRVTNRFLKANRDYLAKMDRTGLQSAFNLLTDGTRSALLYSHGPVIPITHAIDVAFNNPVKFLKTWMRAVGTKFDPDLLDKIFAKMERDPLFKTFHLFHARARG